jgi:hypothetical protein
VITRRMAAGLLGALPFARRTATEVLRTGVVTTVQSADRVGRTMGGGYPGEQQGGQVNRAPVPLMPSHQAFRLALRTPHVRDAIMEAVWRDNRRVHAVDPDIEIYRSFSPMAKITFQRQRNVERELQERSEPDSGDLLEPLRKFLDWHIWGRGR